jgi:hypothetical protein
MTTSDSSSSDAFLRQALSAYLQPLLHKHGADATVVYEDLKSSWNAASAVLKSPPSSAVANNKEETTGAAQQVHELHKSQLRAYQASARHALGEWAAAWSLPVATETDTQELYVQHCVQQALVGKPAWRVANSVLEDAALAVIRARATNAYQQQQQAATGEDANNNNSVEEGEAEEEQEDEVEEGEEEDGDDDEDNGDQEEGQDQDHDNGGMEDASETTAVAAATTSEEVKPMTEAKSPVKAVTAAPTPNKKAGLLNKLRAKANAKNTKDTTGAVGTATAAGSKPIVRKKGTQAKLAGGTRGGGRNKGPGGRARRGGRGNGGNAK